MATTNSLTSTIAIAVKLAAKLQAECLKVRKQLFYDPKSGFCHNVGGVRTDASVNEVETYINNLTDNLIRFKFRSHRMLWFTVQGVSKRYILAAPTQFASNIEDSKKMNPYLKIEKEVLKAASELRTMERVYYELLNAA